ncbi:MAG: NUDIX domain-containing protein [Shimia sp.]
MRVFLYGTMRWRPLFELVVGDASWENATLPAHAVFWSKAGPYPVIAPAFGRALGKVVDMDAEGRARLDYYEGGFGYALQPVTLGDDSEAHTYMPTGDPGALGATFSLEEWIAAWGPQTLRAAAELMAGYAPKAEPPSALWRRRALARASAYERALTRPPSARLAPKPEGEVRIVAQRHEYAKFYRFDEMELDHPRFDGTRSGTLLRAGMVGGDAAIVLPYDPLRDEVLLVEQIRPITLLAGESDPWLLEPIAGAIEPGQTAEDAAHREAQEEAGLTLDMLHLVTRSFASPGNCTEFFNIFIGLADLSHADQRLAGLADEDEDIRAHVIPYAQFEQILDSDGFRATPLVTAGHWLARNRGRLLKG